MKRGLLAHIPSLFLHLDKRSESLVFRSFKLAAKVIKVLIVSIVATVLRVELLLLFHDGSFVAILSKSLVQPNLLYLFLSQREPWGPVWD